MGEFSLPLLTVEGTVPDGQPETFNVESDTFEVTAPFSLSPSLRTSVSPQNNPSDLLYATFLGGGEYDPGKGIAVDGEGAVYMTGYTNSADFPVGPGYDTTLNSSSNAFVVKLNAAGTGLVYATFLGGGDNNWGEDIAVDGAGAAYVTGYTDSADFPAGPGYDTTYNGGYGDAFIVKLNAAGTGLVYATFLGGGEYDMGYGITVDGSGAAYITGYTESSDFPTTAEAFDPTHNGGRDAFVVKLNPSGSALAYATFLGSGGYDYGYGIAVDGTENAYVTGWSRSPYFPTTPGAFDTTHNGGYGDAFIVKLNAAGSALVYATFLGGGDHETGYGITVDGSGAAYMTGYTNSADFPAGPGYDTTHHGEDDAFVVKLNAAGTGLNYATFLGGDDGDRGKGIAVDGSGAAYVTGDTYSSDLPTTPEAFDTTYNGGTYGNDAFVVKLNPAGSALAYATFLGGGDDDDWGSGIAVDAGGAAYVTGYTESTDFPTTPGAFDTTYNGGDAFVVKLSVGGITVAPVYPTAHTAPSSVMQGGTVYRHFRLFQGSAPMSNANVNFSTGALAVTDSSGYFTYTIAANTLGGVGTYNVTIESATYQGETHTFDDPVTFDIVVQERRYAHTWEAGVVRKVSGGIDAGLIAYLTGEVNGGIGLTLEENDADLMTDDSVTIEEVYAGEGGFGFGAEIAYPLDEIEVLNVEGPGAHMIGEEMIRAEFGINNTFDQPYTQSARELQGLMLLAGIGDSVSGLPSQPLIAALLSKLNLALPYDEYTRAWGLHETIDAGLDNVELSIGFDGESELDALDIEILALNAERTILVGKRSLDDLESIFYLADFEWLLTQLGDEGGALQGFLGRHLGEYVMSVKEEIFYDPDTRQLDRIEISLMGTGSEFGFPDMDQSLVTQRYTIQADHVDQELLNAAFNLSGLIRGMASTTNSEITVGEDPIVAEINGILRHADVAEYEIITRDGEERILMPEIDITTGLKLELGAGLNVARNRVLLYEQGALLEGQPYKIATYKDAYIAAPGKTWVDLVGNAMGGLWDLVGPAFTWRWQLINLGFEWVVDTWAENEEGVIVGGAKILAPGQGQTAHRFSNSSITASDTVTVTAAGWVPTTASAQRSNLATQVASGDGFVVGGIYQFQPYTLTLEPDVSLVLTYTEDALVGVDEEHLGVFRWEPTDNNWQSIAAVSDTSHDVFTATIDQLGTFALGYDATPPTVDITSPVDRSTIRNAKPWIQALVSDTGTGIDPRTVEIQLNGSLVAGDYITSTGQLAYMPDTVLSDGVYTVTVSAADVMGNQTSTSASFTIDTLRYVYLPLILRK